MSRFTGPLDVEFLNDGEHVMLKEPLVWELDEKGSGMTVTVPPGFVSDGATVPRLFWWFMPPFRSKGVRAAILHDYLLSTGLGSRKAADRQFYLALRALDVPAWRAFILWSSVRLFGILKTWWISASRRV